MKFDSIEIKSESFLSLFNIEDWVFIDQDLCPLFNESSVTSVYVEGERAGYILIEDKGDYQEVLFIEILPRFRRHGLGIKLLMGAIDPYRPVRLLAFDSSALAFFNKVKELGLIEDLEIEQ